MNLSNFIKSLVAPTGIFLLAFYGCKNSENREILPPLKKETYIRPESLNNELDTVTLKKSSYKKIEPQASFILFSSQSVAPTIKLISGIKVEHDIDNYKNSSPESFKLLVKRNDKRIAYFTVSGAAFPEKILEFNNKKALSGDLYIFYDIKFRLKDGKIITLPSIEWLIP